MPNHSFKKQHSTLDVLFIPKWQFLVSQETLNHQMAFEKITCMTTEFGWVHMSGFCFLLSDKSGEKNGRKEEKTAEI